MNAALRRRLFIALHPLPDDCPNCPGEQATRDGVDSEGQVAEVCVLCRLTRYEAMLEVAGRDEDARMRDYEERHRP